MKSFKKLSQEKSANVNNLFLKNEETKNTIPGRKASDFKPILREVVALSTVKNFSQDMLVSHSVDSKWLITTNSEVNSPRFQEKFLKNKDELTNLCNKMANVKPQKVTIVVASSPMCHCVDLKQPENEKVTPYKRFIGFMKNVWRRLCGNLNICTACVKSGENEKEELESICMFIILFKFIKKQHNKCNFGSFFVHGTF